MMSFPLQGVTLTRTGKVREIEEPAFTGENFRVNQREFSLVTEGTGSFYAANGNHVEFSAVPGADPEWVKLFLNGQVLVALLHQRKIINFHASSFIYNGSGIMILGETGAGKSSLTASFALNGARFLSDDLTPVIFKKRKPQIWPVTKAIKLSEDTVEQLNIDAVKLTMAEAGTGKLYLNVAHAGVKYFPISMILKIETGDCAMPEFHEPPPSERFSLLRSEICSWEMLAGMPETEAEYLHQLLAIVQQVRIVKIVRPADIKVSVLHEAVSEVLESLKV